MEKHTNISATVQQMKQGVFNPIDDYGNFSGVIMPTMGNAQANNIQGDTPTVPGSGSGSGMPVLREAYSTFTSKGLCVKCLTVAVLAIVIGGYLLHHFSFQESAEI